MRFFFSALVAAGLCLAALAGCGGDGSDDKAKSQTKPFPDDAKKYGDPLKKDGKTVGFQ